MKKLLCMSAAIIVVWGTAGLASAAQYVLPETDPLYDLNWATTMVDGTGYIPASSDPDPGDSYYYNSWQDGSTKPPNPEIDPGVWAVGTPDMVYGDPEGVYEMFGGATGFSPKMAPDNWMVLGFDAPVTDQEGTDLLVYQLGGWGGHQMQILVSTDDVYTTDGSMAWISLGYLDTTSKPMAWATGSACPYMEFDFSDYGGITGDVNYVMFAGYGHWIDAVGAPVSAVPIPAGAWLLGSGLLGLVGVRRKRS